MDLYESSVLPDICVDRISFYIKQQITKDLCRDIVCMFEIICVTNVYHYIAANKVL